MGLLDFLQIADTGESWSMVISAFFDESGKIGDHSEVSYAGVACLSHEYDAFDKEWSALLRGDGHSCLSMKGALNDQRPFTRRNPAIGAKKRIDALLPYVACVKKHFRAIICSVIDADCFRDLDSETKGNLHKNPAVAAFTRTIMEIVNCCQRNDSIAVMCDDEEEIALSLYKMYRRLKIAYAPIRARLSSITFADDKFYIAIQAADLVASLSRLEGAFRFRNQDNQYRVLFKELEAPGKGGTLICGMWGKQNLQDLAATLQNAKKARPDADFRLIV